MLSEVVFFSCHKSGHVRKYCPTKAPAPSKEDSKGKDKFIDDKRMMNGTWKKKEAHGVRNESEVTSSFGLSDHTTST